MELISYISEKVENTCAQVFFMAEHNWPSLPQEVAIGQSRLFGRLWF
jgi:hypothetical protein